MYIANPCPYACDLLFRRLTGAFGNISRDIIQVAIFRLAERNVVVSKNHNEDCVAKEDRLAHVVTDRV